LKSALAKTIMKTSSKVWAALLILSFALTGCGVMFGGSRFNYSIIAKDHPNANIYVDGNNVGTGFATGFYPRNRPLTVKLRQDGCENKSETFHNTFRTVNFALSVIMWGVPGMAIDLGTGAAYKPDHVNNPSIQRMNDKYFVFTVAYPGCPTE
jgi:hypothetical protein